MNVLLLCGVSLIVWQFEVLDQVIPSREETSVSKNWGPSKSVQVSWGDPFIFRDDFSFPQPRVMERLAVIKSSSWMRGLHRYLRSLNEDVEYIHLLTSNFKYIDVLLNWLISAAVRNNIPTQNILIVSMDTATHKILLEKKFCSILVPPFSLFSLQSNFSKPFEKVMMLRLTLMRIINHFGFNVAMFDTDAILLRDPKHIFGRLANADIIGSVGTIPDDLFMEWGVTICIGVVLIKSSVRTGEPL